MEIFLFRSSRELDLFGFTADPTGNNLPGEFGPWQIAGAGTAAQAYAGTSLDGLASSDPVIKAVEREGFYLARSGVTISTPTKPGTVVPDRVTSTDEP